MPERSDSIEKDIELGVCIRHTTIELEIARRQYESLFGDE